MRRHLFFSFILALGVAGPLGAQSSSAVIARVGKQELTIADLQKFSAPISAAYRSKKTPLENDQEMLKGLVDKTLLLLEAKSQGLDRNPLFKQQMASFEEQQIIGLYRSREINQKVTISQEELQEQFLATNRDRALRIAGILLETEAEALQTLEEIRGGASFHKLAMERSLYEETREQGGDMGRYLIKDDTAPVLMEPVFKLAVGEISEPIAFGYRGKRRYTIIKVLDEMPAALEGVEDKVREEIYARKRVEREAELTETLKEKYAPRIDGEKLSLLLQRVRKNESDEPEALVSEGATLLCHFANGGGITFDELFQAIPKSERTRERLADSTWVVDFLHQFAIPLFLYMEDAQRNGLGQDPTVLTAVANERDDVLLSVLRQREVDQRVADTSLEEAKAFYEAHPEKFATYENVVVNEVLVSFKDQAQELKDQLTAGADPKQLARDYTIRPDMGHHGGRLTLSPFTEVRYPGLYEVARDLEIGAVAGPVKTKQGYSVFKVAEKVLPQTKPFHEASQARAKTYVKIDKSRRAFVDYMRSLRQKYSVEIYEDNLEKIHRQATNEG